ncbi:hypothetical protein J1N35_044326 [Gossypium stocksii]|uniref:Protein FAR1-RELATED SEQUENCE n=1 Tax=Gossypium stocksii TaxID=47602 RepID=A0A9D3ZG50_9ROSI|nr:hypothetical protein J1N35_044326 [Gossypium stocksii]
MIRFTVQDDQWIATRFISEHNHKLASPSKRHLLRSARPIPVVKDEATASFAWLFKSFLQSMGSQPLKNIITDQDYAISKAIGEIFLDSCHTLCLWHISKNTPSHLGLYTCREKWSTAFSTDIFSSQIKSFQRAEDTNNVLHGISKATTSLSEFFIEFENLVARWHSSEAEKNFQCRNGSITCAIKNCGILSHASKVYTYEIYKCFEKEFLDGVLLIWREVAQNDTTYTFEVMMDEKSSRVRIVHFNIATIEIHCTCKKFSFCGYLCSHALRILSVKNVKKISDRYISQRWTKDVKKDMYGGNVAEFSQKYNTKAEVVFRNLIIRFAYDLIIKSQENEKTRQFCQKILYEGDMEVEKELTKLFVSKNNELKENETNARAVIQSSHSFNDDASKQYLCISMSKSNAIFQHEVGRIQPRFVPSNLGLVENNGAPVLILLGRAGTLIDVGL